MTDLDLPDDLRAETWSALERLGRALHVPNAPLEGTLEAILLESLRTVPVTSGAGVNLFVRGHFEPQAVFGEAPPKLDSLQKQLGDGPCIAASRDQILVHVVDMRDDARWPRFAQAALALGVQSMLCVPLWVDEQRLGSLSLYSDSRDAFTERDAHIASLLATHAAFALTDALRSTNLRQALNNRDTIGQAKGILMERHRITADEAFALLVASSQRLNRKLAEVAETVTLTGAVP